MHPTHFPVTVRRFIGLAACGLALLTAPVMAQTWPAKPIKMIVPFSAGGPTDAYARLIAQGLTESLGQAVIVDNKPGATGIIGSTAVRDATPDGYTLLFTSNSAHVMGPLLHKPNSFDPVADFTPVMMVLRYPMYLITSTKVPATNLKEFIALLKSRPGKMSYSSVGVGSGGHLACELFNIATGVDTLHVAFKGASPAQQALVAGQVDYMCDSVGFSQPLVDAGKLKGMALFSPKRLPAVPNVPTMTEMGVNGVDAYIWLGIYGPKGMPDAIRDKLNGAVAKIINEPAFKERVDKGGYELISGTPDQLTRDVTAEKGMWNRIITDKNIKPE